MLVPLSNGKDGSTPSTDLTSLIASCREELDILREDIAWHGKSRGAGDLHHRLARTTDRLETALETLQRLHRLQRPSADADNAPFLVRDADHRLRNGLTTVLSILHRQAETSGDADVGEALRLARARIAVVTELHAQIGTLTAVVGDEREVALDRYLVSLGTALSASVPAARCGRTLVVRAEPLGVTPNTAQSIGLIVIELALCALRRARNEFAVGQVTISGERRDGTYRLTVEDHTLTLPPDDPGPDEASLRLMRTLTEELGAELAWQGARAILRLPDSP